MAIEEDYFKTHVPNSLQRALLRAVLDGCTTAHDEASVRDKDFFVDAIPALRRLAVEPMLSKLVLPPGFESTIVRTTSTNYTQIASERVVITAVTRAEAVTFVEPYRYRETLARSRQVAMPFMGMDEYQDQRGKLYALLIYGGPHEDRLPAIAQVVFPLPTGHLVSDGINLLSDHADIAQVYSSQNVGADGPDPKLRDKADEQDK